MKMFKKIKKAVIYALIITLLLSNQMICYSASVVLSSVSELILSPKSIGDDIYLVDIMTLDKGETYIASFKNPGSYLKYYGTSNDLINWELNAPYFSIAYGNGIYAGIAYVENEGYKLNYTLNGVTWKTVDLQNGLEPNSIKFENGYFKLYGYVKNQGMRLLISKDFTDWIDITENLYSGINYTVISDEKLYTFSDQVYSVSILASEIPSKNNLTTNWIQVAELQKDKYGFSNFYFDGSSVGVKLYPIDWRSSSDSLYFVSSDFVNWSEKDWTDTNYFYSIYEDSSTENPDLSIDNYIKAQVYPLDPNHNQKIIISDNGTDWSINDIKISLNGKIVNKIEESNEEYVLEDGVLFNKDKTKLLCYTYSKDDKKYTIPSSVEEIENHAFLNCKNLENITIPDSVTNIRLNAFENCNNLTTITIPDSVTNIDSWAFYNCNKLNTVYYNGTKEQWNKIRIDWGNDALKSAKIQFTAAAKKIALPTFIVTFNGQTIDNNYSQYPLIVYNDITYFPMTYNDSRFLGVETSYTPESGLIIKSGAKPADTYKPYSSTTLNSSNYTAEIAIGKITVNGTEINNKAEKYPLLLFRDVTYFPLTWRFAVEMFGWNYSFDNVKGLVISNAAN